MSSEPIHDIAHLAHVELLTDKPEASLDFFVNVYGLTESGREGNSVYLRAWDDYEFHTLKLTAALPGMHTVSHINQRACAFNSTVLPGFKSVGAISRTGRYDRPS